MSVQLEVLRQFQSALPQTAVRGFCAGFSPEFGHSLLEICGSVAAVCSSALHLMLRLEVLAVERAPRSSSWGKMSNPDGGGWKPIREQDVALGRVGEITEHNLCSTRSSNLFHPQDN